MYVNHYNTRIESENCSDRELCAIINSNNALREYVESITDLVVDSLTEDQQIDLNQLLSTITEPLTELNTTAAHALSDLIIGDIDASNVMMMNACDV